MIISGCPEPLVASAAGWIKGALGMLDQDEAETGRGSWGRDSELDEEPTLLHDSEPVLESLPVLLLLAVLSPRTRPGEMPLKLLALAMAGRGASRLELSELSVLLHGRGSPCRGSVSVSELLCRLAPDRPARNLNICRLCWVLMHASSS